MHRDDDRATGRSRSQAVRRHNIEPTDGSRFSDAASSDDRRRTESRSPKPDDRGRAEDRGRPEDRGWRPVNEASGAVSRIDSSTTPEMPAPFRRIGNGSARYRGQSHSDEAEPTQYHFSRWQAGDTGQLSNTWLTAISLALVGAALLLVAIVPGLLNGGGSQSDGSPSAPNASGEVVVPPTADPTLARLGTPTPAATSAAPQASFRTYKVQAGDTLTRIANKFGLKTWELLAANPNLTANSSLHINSVLNIPNHGQLTPAP